MVARFLEQPRTAEDRLLRDFERSRLRNSISDSRFGQRIHIQEGKGGRAARNGGIRRKIPFVELHDLPDRFKDQTDDVPLVFGDENVPAVGGHRLPHPGVEVWHHPHDGQPGTHKSFDRRERLAGRYGDYQGPAASQNPGQRRKHIGKHLGFDGEKQGIRPLRYFLSGIADADAAFLKECRKLARIGIVDEQIVAGKSAGRHAAKNGSRHVARTDKPDFHPDSPILWPVRCEWPVLLFHLTTISLCVKKTPANPAHSVISRLGETHPILY